MGKGRAKAPDFGPLARANIRAAEIMAAAHREQTALWDKWNIQWREDQMPWRERGLAALGEIGEGMKSGRFDEPFEGVKEWSKDWETEPGYQFRLKEGLKAMRRNAAAGSGAFTGAANKAYMGYAQGLASEEFSRARARALQDYSIRQAARDRDYNRLAGQSGTGQIATTQMAATGMQALQQRAGHAIGAAEATGSGLIGAANAGIQQQYARNAASNQNWNNLWTGVGTVLGGASLFV